MVVPTGLAEFDDFDFEQSSNRMCIECAFGILIRRWGILWRPLEMQFEKRSAVIAACMRLHNWCIDKRIQVPAFQVDGGLSEIQPNRWERTPKFDKDGAPVAYLETEARKLESAAAVARSVDFPRGSKRKELIAAIRDAGLVRPKAPINLDSAGKRQKL